MSKQEQKWCVRCGMQGHQSYQCGRPVHIFAGLMLALAAAASSAADIAEAQGESGYLVLTDQAGACVGAAKAARWHPNGGGAAIPGCWRAIDGGVQVAFLDGDALRVPSAAFSRPNPA